MGNRVDVVALLLKVVSLLHIRLLWFVCQVAKDLMQLWDVDWVDGVDKSATVAASGSHRSGAVVIHHSREG